jgi:REP element-mobilizing transposase RayT
MRQVRELKQGVWYKIRTRINNREPLFRFAATLALFAEVFGETRLRFVFEIRALCLVDDWLTFYIKPADGLKLPDIMKWLKQVFAQRYNRQTGRIGHIWGDRYWSLIVEDAEAEGAETAGEQRGETSGGVRPQYGETDLRGKPRYGERDLRLRPRYEERDLGVRPQYGKTAIQTIFSFKFPLLATPIPG